MQQVGNYAIVVALTSPCDLDEYLDLVADKSLHYSWIPACRFDGDSSPFEILNNVDISLDKYQCNHRPVCHPTPETWFDITSAVAITCQPRLGHKLLTWLSLKSTLSKCAKTVQHHEERRLPGLHATSLRPHVLQEVPVRGLRLLMRPRDLEDEQCIGGLRHAHQAVKRLPYGVYSGKLLAGILDEYLASSIGIEDSQFLLSLLG